MKINIARLKILLSPEQLKAMEEVFHQTELTLESFDLLRKDYARVKANVKKIEKRLLNLIEEEGPDYNIVFYIEREVTSIENKYKAIDHAIKHYNYAMQTFNSTINSPHFLSFTPSTNYYSVPYNLRTQLSSAMVRVEEALDAIRITGRYFKNITGYFKMHNNRKLLHKQMLHRQRLNDAKAAQEQNPPTLP